MKVGTIKKGGDTVISRRDKRSLATSVALPFLLLLRDAQLQMAEWGGFARIINLEKERKPM